MNAPCYGKSALFDSTMLADHAEAAALCATCPLIDACNRRLTETLEQAVRRPGCGPDGTWAGRLLMGGKFVDTAKIARVEFEESLFSEDAARRCHSLFIAGHRDEWTVAGERTYQRRASRRQRRDRKARAAA